MNTPCRLRKNYDRNAPRCGWLRWVGSTVTRLQSAAKMGKAGGRPPAILPARALLEFSAAAGFGDLLQNGFRICFRNPFLDGFRRTVDEVLGFLQTQSRDRTHDLDHVDLVRACG